MTQRRKRTWYLGLMQTLGQAVNVASFATSHGADGFIRQVRLSFTIENGSREVAARLNPADARAYAQAIIDAADRADALNTEQGNGNAYLDHWVRVSQHVPLGLGGVERRPVGPALLPKLYAYGRCDLFGAWPEEVQVMERTEDSITVRLLNSGDTIRLINVPRTAEGVAMLTFRDDDWEILTEQTALADRHPRRAPRLEAFGYYTADPVKDEGVRVQVMERTDDSIVIQPVGSGELISVPRNDTGLPRLKFHTMDWEVTP